MPSCTILFDSLNCECMEWRSPGRYDAEPCPREGAPELNVAEFHGFRMKPCGAAIRASDCAPFVIGDPKFLRASNAGDDCQSSSPHCVLSRREISVRRGPPALPSRPPEPASGSPFCPQQLGSR